MSDLFADGGEIGADLPASAWPQRLRELVDHLEARFTRRLNDPDLALALAEETALALADLCGGRQIYMPRGQAIRIALRDARIWKEFNGRNIEFLAGKYGVSVACVYQIIARQRRMARQQPDLFE